MNRACLPQIHEGVHIGPQGTRCSCCVHSVSPRRAEGAGGAHAPSVFDDFKVQQASSQRPAHSGFVLDGGNTAGASCCVLWAEARLFSWRDEKCQIQFGGACPPGQADPNLRLVHGWRASLANQHGEQAATIGGNAARQRSQQAGQGQARQ